MIAGHGVSGLIILSEGEKLCYPYVESLTSFLPIVGEVVVCFNVYGEKDGSREKLEALGSKVRIIPSVFDIEKYGWTTFGVARTAGYHACKGEIVLKFDADGVLHEKDIQLAKDEIISFRRDKVATGYWNKKRIYKANLYYEQHKHSGIYNKGILGDRMDWLMADGKGAPNFDRLTESEQRSRQFQTTLFGYEHLWDTEEVLRYKVNRYGRMIDRQIKKPLKTPEEYFKDYIRERLERLAKDGKSLSMDDHPAIIREKLESLNETHFGYNFFGYKR